MARPSVEAQRRVQIMRSTCRVIAARGVIGLRVVDVARDASISPGIVHYYFDTKLDLIRTSFEYNFDRSLERRDAIVGDLRSHTADVLDRLFASYCPQDPETVEAWQVWIELWAAALHDAELRSANDRAYSRWAASVERLIAVGQARGELRAGDPAAMADHLTGLLDGLAVQVLVSSHGMTADRMRAVCSAVIAAMREDPER